MEKKIINNFKNSIILKPSIVYSVDDKFTTNFMSLLSRLPIMPFIIMAKQNLVLFMYRLCRYNSII